MQPTKKKKSDSNEEIELQTGNADNVDKTESTDHTKCLEDVNSVRNANTLISTKTITNKNNAAINAITDVNMVNHTMPKKLHDENNITSVNNINCVSNTLPSNVSIVNNDSEMDDNDESTATLWINAPQLTETFAKNDEMGECKLDILAKRIPQLNAEVLENFDKTGKMEFLSFIRNLVKRSNHDIYELSKKDNSNYSAISGAIYDLLLRGVKSRLKKETIISTLSEIVSLHKDFPSLIIDVVSALDAETSVSMEYFPEERESFFRILKDLDRIIPEKLIKERLEIDTLQEVGIVKRVFYTKFIKIKTKLYYKQRRFNLFREESEGYAKLVVELNPQHDEETTAESVMDILKSLIGCFNLDPNRVLDIILETLESCSQHHKFFIDLIHQYMPTDTIITDLLGYKFRHFAEEVTPYSLYHVCALLVKHNVIKIDDIYLWLCPTDTDIRSEWESAIADANEYSRKLNIIYTNKDKEKEEEVIPVEQEVQAEVTEKLKTSLAYHMNQKLMLCEHLLLVGDWENASEIIRKLPEQSVVFNERIALALADIIHISLDNLYYSHFLIATRTKRSLSTNAELVAKFQAATFTDLLKYAIPMAITLGAAIHYDTVLMYKLVRLFRVILTNMGVDNLNTPNDNQETESLYFGMISVLDESLLPALSFLHHNCPVAEEIWTVLKMFPYHFRYSIYGHWKNESYKIHPNLIRQRGDAIQRIKALMKRVSKENVKPVGRQLGKLSHCTPGTLFDYILVQIQIYDNLIGPVVDSLKYLNALSFDCLGFCIIEALTMAGRDRIKHDGTSIAMWLQNIASFCGAVYKKYNIELSGLLQYVANQLKAQKSLDLLILKEIVQKMSGVESAEEMTNEQLNAMCGGELLRGEAGYFSQVRNTKKSSQRLKEALANNDLAVGICLLMAQQKHCVIYRETAHSHLKLVGKLYDQCQDTLVQFGTFLGSTYTVDEYVERLPSVVAMLQDYHINADVAFFLARPMFAHQINQKYDLLRKADPNAKKLTSAQKQLKYLDATYDIWQPIVESVRPLHGLKVWEDISPQFFVTFWSLSMYDLQVPTESYQKEITKLKILSAQLAEAKDSNGSKNKKEHERYLALMEKLQDERKKQQEHVDKILQLLQQQKDTWFLSRSAKSAKNETITQFLQLCVFPRCTFTALDALYCAKFVHTIHNLKTANFSTLLCYDRIFCDITISLTSCTENEATRYGRFLCSLLEMVMRWHGNQDIFNKECAHYPGFVTKFRVSNQFSEANDNVGYENYRHVCHKWHYKITKAIVFCLDSKDYMQIRNAFIILMRILPYYPVLVKLGQIIERKVERVREEEKNKRPDLFVIASSYIGQLKNKSSQMVLESDFHHVADRAPTNNASNSNLNVSTNSVLNLSPSSNNGLNATVNNTTTSSSQHPAANSAQSTGASGGNAIETIITKPANVNSKVEKREKDVTEKPKIIKISTTANANVNAGSSSSYVNLKERETKHTNLVSSTSSSNVTNNTVTTNRNVTTIDIREDTVDLLHGERERERERQPSSVISTTRISKKKDKQDDRERDRERERERERESDRVRERERIREHRNHNDEHDIVNNKDLLSRLERKKRRDNTPTLDVADTTDKHHHEFEREQGHDRDLSSVSNESNVSSIRRNQNSDDYDKDIKRRKVDASSLSNPKKGVQESIATQLKKDRTSKTKDSRKEKQNIEEKDTGRKERKLGRKRERLEETSNVAHKRRRDVPNGEEEIRDRDKHSTHSRDKSPLYIRDNRERSHENRDRNSREDRHYSSKSSRSSRVAY